MCGPRSWLAGVLVALATGQAAEIEFGNDSLRLSIDPATGALVEAVALPPLAPAETRLLGGDDATVDVQAGGRWCLSQTKVPDRGGDGGIAGSVTVGPAEVAAARQPSALRLVSHQVDEHGGMHRLALVCEAPDWQIRVIYELPRAGAWWRRRAEWTYGGRESVAVTGVRFSLPRIRVGDAGDCTFTMPTFWPPRDTPFTGLVDGRRQQAHAAAATPPGVAVCNARQRLGLAATFYTTDDWSAVAAVEGKDSVTVQSEVYPQAQLKTGDTLRLGDEVVSVVSGGVLDALTAIGEGWTRAGFRLADRPDWAWGTSLYSLWLGGSLASGCRDLGGLRSFQTSLLPRLDRLGIDVVWFNPINPGSYGPTVHRDVDPQYGTLDDLKAVCDDAHRRGMRIWLDLIPHGPREKSPDGEAILRDHPDWVSRGKDGAITYWWGCLACDYAHPGWQAEMADVATFFVGRCGVDGWRVDCAAGGPPNERPYNGLRPSQSSLFGAQGLLATVDQAMKRADPDSVLLGETSAAALLARTQFIYDWTTQHAAWRSLPDMPVESWVAATRTWLERQQAALPANAVFGLMRFLENHDQYRSLCRYGAGHEQALLSVCALVPGLVFVFNEQDQGFGPHLERLLRIRHDLPEFQRGRAVYSATTASAPDVLAFSRQAGTRLSTVAVNFGPDERAVILALPVTALAESADPGLYGLYSGTEAYEGRDLGQRTLAEWRCIQVPVPAYGTRVVVLRPAGEALPGWARPAPSAAPTSITDGPIQVVNEGDAIVLERGLVRLALANGLIRSLTAATGEPLVQSMNVVEGRRKVWPGPRLDFAASVTAKGTVRQQDGATVVDFGGVLDRGAGVRVPWESHYTMSAGGEVRVELCLTPPPSELPVLGQLGVEIGFGAADRWVVNTLEGPLCDDVAVTHPKGVGFEGQGYWHRSGLLWEAGPSPLASGLPSVAVRSGAARLSVWLPEDLGGMENAWLREPAAGADGGPVLHLAWLDGKGRANLVAPLRLAFRLSVAGTSGPPPRPGPARTWDLTATGSRYTYRNGGRLEVDLGRSLGGSLLRFARPGGESAVVGSQVYSDFGLYAAARDSLGNEEKVMGASRQDFEPDVLLRRRPDGLSLTFSSYLRMSYWDWAHVANPRVAYEVSYDFDGSARAGVRCRVRPMVTEPELKAFLAQTLSIRGAKSWTVQTAKGPRSGPLPGSPGPGGRVWQSRADPLAENGMLELALADGSRLRFGGLAAPASEVQNVFLLDSGGGDAVLFIAFLDGQPIRCQPVWHSATYSLELVTP